MKSAHKATTVAADRDPLYAHAWVEDFVAIVRVARDLGTPGGDSFKTILARVKRRIGPAIRAWQREWTPTRPELPDEALAKVLLPQARRVIGEKPEASNLDRAGRLMGRVRLKLVALVPPSLQKEALRSLQSRMQGIHTSR